MNQLEVAREDVVVTVEDLLAVPAGAITSAGLRQNVAVGLRYLAAWLCGDGCVPLFHLMEDAATAEISRAQLWQWRRHGARLADGGPVDATLIRARLNEELERIRTELGEERFEARRFPLAGRLFEELVLADTLADFLTLPAAAHLR